MKLDDWQKLTKINNSKLAKMVKCHEAMISRIKSGERSPSLDLAWDICEATTWAVTLEDIARIRRDKGLKLIPGAIPGNGAAKEKRDSKMSTPRTRKR